MLKSKIFRILCSGGLTKELIEDFFREKKINAIKWAVVRVSDNYTEVLTTFIKKN